MEFKGAIFDLDGVITKTAKIHSKAWKEMFDEFLEKYSKESKKPFVAFNEKKDYLKYVDGKPRIKGVEDFLKSRNINLPLGDSNDAPRKNTMWGIANRKNKIFLKIIKKIRPKVYESTIKFIKELKKSGIKIALISSSRNCKKVLKTAGVKKLFKVIVDGNLSRRAGLIGKPDPDIFVYAVKKLKLFPRECVVFEDAVSGVDAGIRGNFGMVVGISRKSFNLKKADKVVSDLRYLSVSDIRTWFREGMQKDSWDFDYHDFSPEKEKLRETLCTIGNGYIGTRGCHETQSDLQFHYPGCYIGGIYNELKTKIKSKIARNNSLVNCPNWTLIKIKIGGKLIQPFEEEILDYEKMLDVKDAVLRHKIVFKDKKGRITELKSKRFASMANPHLCGIVYNIKPVNYSEKIALISFIDGNVKNNNVQRYRGLKSRHLKAIFREKVAGNIVLHTKTNTSKCDVVMSARNKFFSEHKNKTIKTRDSIGEEISFKAKQGKDYSLAKTLAVFTSNDSQKPKEDSIKLLKKNKKFDSVLEMHEKAWRKIWDVADVYLEGDRFVQKVLRFYTYHLISTYSPNVVNFDLGIPARGLHGEAYRGHIFWDEIYVLPFFIHHFPEIAKAALIYRYKRLSDAKESAKERGFEGAMYPWESADSGKEETQTIHYNPMSKKWGPDYSQNQRHVSIAVFYNFYKYFTHTKDYNFLSDYALPVMTEIARFLSSLVKYDDKTKKYHIKGVMGPDEFHEKYPGSKRAGIDDNAYTNIMTAWVFKKMPELIDELPDKKKPKIKKQELEKWKNIRKNINVVVKNGVIMQFAGFDRLKKLNFARYKKKYGNIGRIDRILRAEKKSPNDYQAIKQADMLMIFYLLDFKEAIKILKELGIKIKNSEKFIRRNYEYYLARTTHGSTLSKFVHDAIATELDEKPELIWDWFKQTLETDVYDSQGGTTSEGIHCAMMTGVINIVRKYFAGVKTYKDGIAIKHWFPKHWRKLIFNLTHQKKVYNFDYDSDDKNLKVILKKGRKSFVKHGWRRYHLRRGIARNIKLEGFIRKLFS